MSIFVRRFTVLVPNTISRSLGSCRPSTKKVRHETDEQNLNAGVTAGRVKFVLLGDPTGATTASGKREDPWGVEMSKLIAAQNY